MDAIVFSYSLTGNNETLAKRIARELKVDYIKITEHKSRTVGRIVLDMLFNRTPRVSPTADVLDGHELVLFVGPVWMGRVAAPFRSFFKRLKNGPGRYAFISISGGALGPNPKLAEDLEKRTGKAPEKLIDLHIADLLPTNPKPTRTDTSSYRLSDGDVKNLFPAVVKTLREITAR